MLAYLIASSISQCCTPTRRICLLVARFEGRVVGTLIAGWDGWRAQMARLAVEPSLRRSGIARRLVEDGERRLRDRGAKRIYALVDRRSDPAPPFWGALGYAANDDIAQYSRNISEET